MAEMLIQSESLTAIADEIRVLSGTEDAMSLSTMESHISEANTDVATEASLIAQIAAALEGKAGGSGGSSIEDSIITKTISSYTNDRVTSIGSYAFQNCSSLTTVSFPAVITIGNYAFYYCSSLTTANFLAATTIGSDAFRQCNSLTTVSFPAAITISNYAFKDCSSLTTVSFPAATSIGSHAFQSCSSLTTVSFPAVTSIGSDAFRQCNSLTTVSFPAAITISNYAFQDCSNLTTANFPAATTIGNCAFSRCYNLISLYLTGSSLCKLSNSNAFSSTPIGGYSTSAGTYGSIYVPASLLTSYKTATNWTYFSSRFVALGSEDNNNLITFTIDRTVYQAEEGMTWVVWVESEYNIDGYEYKYGRIMRNGISITNIDAYDTIINGNSYYTDD